jgi:hypothetical protein
LTGPGIPRLDQKRPNRTSASRQLLGAHRDRLFAVPDNLIEEGCRPAQVILIFDPSWQKGSEIDELDEPASVVEIVEKGEVGLGVPECREVLDEGNLHLGAW